MYGHRNTRKPTQNKTSLLNYTKDRLSKISFVYSRKITHKRERQQGAHILEYLREAVARNGLLRVNQMLGGSPRFAL